ncbi:YdcF family protein [Muricoccus radiodurans]|uniref:YdcF family protein n=1 Tax=Muricoccus radiodurans TaxID=2231721 RepID=UPI003CECDE00
MRRRVLSPVSVTLAALVLAGLGGFLWFLHRAAEPAPFPPPPSPGIAVLTGGPDRVEAGLLLLTDRPGARLIISGAGRYATLAELMRAAGVEGPDPATLAPRVTLGHAATSTHGNAREVAAWARAGNLREVTVVTAGFHMPRALLELRRAMPDATLHPLPVQPHLPRPVALVREYVKLVGAAAGLSTLVERREPAR